MIAEFNNSVDLLINLTKFSSTNRLVSDANERTFDNTFQLCLLGCSQSQM